MSLQIDKHKPFLNRLHPFIVIVIDIHLLLITCTVFNCSEGRERDSSLFFVINEFELNPVSFGILATGAGNRSDREL